MGHAIPASNIRLKRAYERSSASDGVRILVDRLWPRGLRKEAAALDEWAKDIAPSAQLRKWFGHDPRRWPAFERRYAAELRRQPQALAAFRSLARKAPITLVYSAHDEAHNDAVVLRRVLLHRAPR